MHSHASSSSNVGGSSRIRVAEWQHWGPVPQTYMQPRITVITLGVDDLERAVAFYRDGLGFTTRGIMGEQYPNGAVAFFELQGGLRLALWPRSSIRADTGLPQQPRSPGEFTLGHNVASQAEADVVMARAAQAGAQILKPAQHTSWGGYAGYFQDPDGHVWEVVHNPEFETLGR